MYLLRLERVAQHVRRAGELLEARGAAAERAAVELAPRGPGGERVERRVARRQRLRLAEPAREQAPRGGIVVLVRGEEHEPARELERRPRRERLEQDPWAEP